MELSFNGGRFVALDNELNYREVLDDFPTAKTIRIITYNISKKQQNDALIEALKSTNADVQLITNIPSRQEQYYASNRGMQMRSAARENIRIYLSKLNPDQFPGDFTPLFNVKNHAKIIGTENIVYIGSANFSNESANNIETGILIDDKEFINRLYSEFFDEIKNQSLSYFDDNFSAFRLFVTSLHAKFTCHHRKMLSDLFTDYDRTRTVVADAVFIDTDDLRNLYLDLEELETVCNAADDTYDEANEEYNDALEQMKGRFNMLSIDWLKEVISEGGSLYELASYNAESLANLYLEEHSAEAYDEYLDIYADQAVNIAEETFGLLRDSFAEEADTFLEEFEKLLSALQAALHFTNVWKASKVNPEINNT